MPEIARFGRAETDRPYRPETSANDPREIVITPGWNVRDMTSPETREHIDALKKSILERVNSTPPLPALIYPIKVKYDTSTGVKTLVDGQCRLTACCELWNDGYEILVPNERIKGDDAQLLASSLTGNSGQSLTQWEIGVGCNRLIVGFGWTPAMVAAHICKPIRYVNEAIALADASPEVKQMISAGEVSAPRALQEIKKHGKEKAAAILFEAVEASKEEEPETVSEPEITSADLKLAKKKPAKKKAKPLARTKAASPSDKLLQQARDLCHMITDENQSWEDVMSAAKKLLKDLGK